MSRGTTQARGRRGAASRRGSAPAARPAGRSSRRTDRRRGERTGRRGATAARPGPAGPRRRSRALLLAAALITSLTAGMIFLFFYSAAFVVEDVTFTGGRDEVRAEAAQLAHIPLGRPMARVSESRISERVLADPRIAAVEVDRGWPSSVTVSITERDPVIALRGAGQTWLADAGGTVFEQVGRPSRRLPLVTVQPSPVEIDPGTVSGLAELWRLRPDPAELEGDLTPPRVARNGTVQMTVDQVTLIWGEPTENDKKWQVVRALIGQESIDPQGGTPVRIDVRLPDTPVVTGLPAKAD